MLRKPWLLVLGVLSFVVAVPALAEDLCKPAAPLSQSKCTKDSQCCAGLVCQPVSGINRCEPGCRIGGTFYTSGALNPANQCQSCQPAVSTTAFSGVASGTACNDGNACTRTDTCQNGTCTGANPVVCTAADQCHNVGTCSSSTGVCSNPAKANGTSCNDGNACTRTDTCQAGVCAGANPVICAASDQCHFAGTCSASTGVCSNPAKGNGTSCNDGNACTRIDYCLNGTCTGENQVACTASDQCHVVGTCNTATGVCSNPAKANGTSCNDGNACTRTDTCQSGACTGANPVTCSASDPCHVAGTCNTSTGACSNPNAADGTSCNDGNACTQSDTCQSGACTGTNPVICTPSDPCHVAGACNPATGGCSNPNALDGTSCDDSNGCTQPDLCLAGVCTAGAGNPCANGGTCASGSSGGYSCFCPTGALGVNCGTCASGYTQCSNSCANTQTDAANCGQCGSACAAGETCEAGSCVTPVPAQLAFNLPDGFSPVPGGHAAPPFTVSVVDSAGQGTGFTGDLVTISPGGPVTQGQCTFNTGTCPPPNYIFGVFCCEPDTYQYTISGCPLSQLTTNGTATFSGCVFTGTSGAAVPGAVLHAIDNHFGFTANRSFDISTGGCTAQMYSFLVSTRGFGCGRSGPPPTSTFDPQSCSTPGAPACCTSGGCQPDNYNVQTGHSGVYQPVPAGVLLNSPQGCDPSTHPQQCTLAHPSCFILCFSNDPGCVSPYPPCQDVYPARGFDVPYNGSCSTSIDEWHFAECLQDAEWPTYHAPDGTTHQGTISAGSGNCTVSVNAPTGDIVRVGALGDHWQVSSHGSGYSSCVGVGGPNGDGVQPPDCSELEISNPSVVAGRPSCSDGLACPNFSIAQGNGSATDVYTVYCVP